ncbi:MAG TPA: Holliday junction resolvase RuvX [Thermoanaerobaculia bacterium]|nr:Holliday junction resolvase RuvX [Thermoanaerobaculia bacterium]
MAIVGIDFGSRRIGLAVSRSGVIATPHSVLINQGSLEQAAEQLARIGEQLDADLFVLGLPRSLRHDAASTQAKFERLADLLRQKSCKEVLLWDEALTTVEAWDNLTVGGKRRKQIPREIDMEAARIILQSYLDHLEGGT